MANVLTMFRLLIVPVFIYVFAGASTDSSTLAAALFAIAAVTDLLDGQIARRTHTVTEFGRVADPLADRLLVGSALVILLVDHRLPTLGLMAVLFRDALMMAGYYVLSRQGVTMTVSLWGKASSLVLMLALFLVIGGIPGGVLIFWLGVALSLLSGVVYSLRGIAYLRRPHGEPVPPVLKRRLMS